MSKKHPDGWAGILRDAMSEHELPVYKIAEESGVPQSVLSGFLKGKGLSGKSTERLATFLGFALTRATGRR